MTDVDRKGGRVMATEKNIGMSVSTQMGGTASSFLQPYTSIGTWNKATLGDLQSVMAKEYGAYDRTISLLVEGTMYRRMEVIGYGCNGDKIHLVIVTPSSKYSVQTSCQNTCPDKGAVEAGDMNWMGRPGKSAECSTELCYVMYGRTVATPNVCYVCMVGAYKGGSYSWGWRQQVAWSIYWSGRMMYAF